MRLTLVRITVAAGMAVGLLLSPKLWHTDRHYPTVPVWDGLPDVPAAGGYLVFGAMLALLALVAVRPRARWPVLVFVAVAAGWSLWDQTRWQPWFYQYLALLAAVSAACRYDPASEGTALNVCRLVVAATYFWSGVEKLNVSFATDIFPWLMGPALRLLPDGLAGWAEGQGWAVAVVEAGLGAALLVPRLRAAAVAGVLVMHATLLVCLGPTGHDWNSVVWPWNLALAVLDVLLFADTRGVTARHILWPPGSPLARVSLLLFGVMPAFSLVGWWDPYLSAALYSGNTPQARLTLTDAAAAALPAGVREKHLSDGELDLPGWAMDELNVPGYPARRVFRGVARRLGGPPDVTLTTLDRPNWRTGERQEIAERPDGGG